MLNLFLLICFSILCGAALFCPGVPSKVEALPNAECAPRWQRLLPLLIFALALVSRLYAFGDAPGGMNQDGAMAAVDAKALADYGTDRFGMRYPVHLTAWGYGQMSALLSYLEAPFIKLWGLSAVTARLPLLISSMAGLVFLYLLVRDIYGESEAMAALFIAALSPWHFLQSRWALDCNLFPHFFVAALFFLNRGKESRWCLFFSMILFGLSMYCYGVAIYSVPLFLVAACVLLLAKKKISLLAAGISALVYLVVAFPFIATMAINYFRLPTIETPLFTIPFFAQSMRSGDILFFSDNIIKQFGQNCLSLLRVAILQSKDLPWNDIKGFGTMYLFSLPFTVLGLLSVFKLAKDKTGAWLLLLFLFMGLWTGLATNNVNVNRLNIIFYSLIIFTGLGIYRAIGLIKYVRPVIPAVYLTAFAILCGTYFTSYNEQISEYFLKDFGEAVTAIKDEDAKRFYITADSQSKGTANVSEILTLFYHELDAEYFQGKTEEDGQSYLERYRYCGMDKLAINPEEDAVYIITQDDLGLFEPSLFSFEKYGRFFVARPLSR